jgi:hypothetical protein
MIFLKGVWSVNLQVYQYARSEMIKLKLYIPINE